MKNYSSEEKKKKEKKKKEKKLLSRIATPMEMAKASDKIDISKMIKLHDTQILLKWNLLER